jgi:hemerythrin-like domain-containing protein
VLDHLAKLYRNHIAIEGTGVFPFAASTFAASTMGLPISKSRPGLKVLEVELQVHFHLENNVLFPRAIALQHKYTLRLVRSTSSAESESWLS